MAKVRWLGQRGLQIGFSPLCDTQIARFNVLRFGGLSNRHNLDNRPRPFASAKLSVNFGRGQHFIMRPGRPTGHVRAKWVTWRNEESSETLFYELGQTGKLVGHAGKFQVHHRVRQTSSRSTCLTPKVQEADIVTPKILVAPPAAAAADGFEFDFGEFTAPAEAGSFWDPNGFDFECFE
jgi:hypothetical protein